MNQPQKNNSFLILLILVLIIVFVAGIIIYKKSYHGNSGLSNNEQNLLTNKNNIAKKETTGNTKEKDINTGSFLYDFDKLSKKDFLTVENEIKIQTGALTNMGVQKNLGEYSKLLQKECNNITKGSNAELLVNFDTYQLYTKALEVVSKNEFSMFSDLKNGICKNFSGNDKEMCNIYKTKDLQKLEKYKTNDEYSYYFFKSLIERKNQCSKIQDSGNKDDCNQGFEEFNNLVNTKINSGNLLTNNNIKNGKILNSMGKNNFIKLLNSQFINECSKVNFIN